MCDAAEGHRLMRDAAEGQRLMRDAAEGISLDAKRGMRGIA